MLTKTKTKSERKSIALLKLKLKLKVIGITTTTLILTVCMSHCYHPLYSLQYSIDRLLDAAGKGRLEDVKELVQNGMAVDGRNRVSNYIYTYFTLL